MAIVVFEHEPNETAAQLGRALRDVGHALRVMELHEGQDVPVDLDDVDGVLSMGGPMNVDQPDAHPWMPQEMAYLKAAHEADLPVVGVCLGAQLLATALGGEVATMQAPEVGWGRVQLGFPGTMDSLHAGVPWKTMQFHAHGREVTSLPPGGVPLAGSAACRTQAFKVGLTSYGFQYHFEWTRADLRAFLDRVAAQPQAHRLAGDAELDAARDGIDEHYDWYRRLGDRLAGNLATLLFPIDKRLGHHATTEPVANFKPARS